MSESDTMFNERYWRWAAVQLMHSTDPSYDNRTIANTLKIQIRMAQRLRAQLNASEGKHLDDIILLKKVPRITKKMVNIVLSFKTDFSTNLASA